MFVHFLEGLVEVLWNLDVLKHPGQFVDVVCWHPYFLSGYMVSQVIYGWWATNRITHIIEKEIRCSSSVSQSSQSTRIIPWATPPCSPRSRCLLRCPGWAGGSGGLCGNAWTRLCSGRTSALTTAKSTHTRNFKRENKTGYYTWSVWHNACLGLNVQFAWNRQNGLYRTVGISSRGLISRSCYPFFFKTIKGDRLFRAFPTLQMTQQNYQAILQ